MKAREVWKYPIPGLSTFDVKAPIGAEFLALRLQGNEPQMWFLVDPLMHKEIRRFQIIFTGQTFDRDCLDYIGTFQRGVFVYHLFEVKQ